MSRIVPIAAPQGPYAVIYTWSGTAPYDVWMNGELVVNQGSEARYVAQRPGGGGYYAIEVRDDNSTGTAESVLYSQRLRLQWRGNSDAAVYVVERWDGDSWEARHLVVESGEGYYVLMTLAEEDEAEVRYRVVAEDAAGNDSEVADFIQTMVCIPSPPAVVGSYAAGTGDLTIASG